jgi:tRNA pseudouridine32 synthase/23S rRNA pseudouridine746 synthase
MQAPPRAPKPAIVASGTGWLVLDKPAGLPVHAGPAGGDSVETHLGDWLGPNCQIRQPVHRLDADTSGCLLIATRRSALRALAAAFAQRRVGKLYIAVIDGVAGKAEGRIDQALSKRSSRATGWRMEPDPRGDPAITDWVALEVQGRATLVALLPRTGRTHQLRIHARQIASNAAIRGDALYGTPAAGGMLLHALALGFEDPRTSEPLLVQTGWPARFEKAGFGPSPEALCRLQPLLRSLASMASAMAAGSSG